MRRIKDLIDRAPYLFFWVIPIAVLGYFVNEAWVALGMVVGTAILAGLVHGISSLRKK